MARLHRRGIGKVNIAKSLCRDEYVCQSFEGLDSAYNKLWEDALEGSRREEDSCFWALSRRVTDYVLIPVIDDTVAAMDRCLLSSIMWWNAGQISSAEIAEHAYEGFERWYFEEFLPAQHKRWQESDEFLMEEIDEYFCSAMEEDGVHPVHLRLFSTGSFFSELCSVMEKRILPEVKKRIEGYTPQQLKDSRFNFVRVRRLRKGTGSFFDVKKAEGDKRSEFIIEIFLDENLVLNHAEAVFRALRGSIWAEKFRLILNG
ncbi:MAG: hypothetical protein E7420_01935 [Ruminococcaceae bacterium]|nr:hypothetical protein [Oscillospiraceae bacterium]